MKVHPVSAACLLPHAAMPPVLLVLGSIAIYP